MKNKKKLHRSRLGFKVYKIIKMIKLNLDYKSTSKTLKANFINFAGYILLCVYIEITLVVCF